MVDFASPVLLAKSCLWKSCFLLEKLTVAELVSKYLFAQKYITVFTRAPTYEHPIHTLAISYLYEPFQYYFIICTQFLQVVCPSDCQTRSCISQLRLARVCKKENSCCVLNMTIHFQQSLVSLFVSTGATTHCGLVFCNPLAGL